ncbi:MAG: TonB-dependent receptor [Sphingomonas sp.]
MVSTAAFAQSPDDEGLGDIVVTAERQERSLQKTALSVSVLDGDQIAQEGIASSRDIGGAVPNLIVPQTGTTTSQQQLFIRGLGEIDNSQPGAVGVYIDDVYIPRSYGALFNLVDVQRIEVLRGPQGTLYGRNATAGAIRVETRPVSDELTGSLQLGYGNYDAVELRGYLSGPVIADRLLGAITVQRLTRDGYMYNPTLGQKVNDLDQWVVRGKLEFRATDRLTLTLGGDYFKDRSDPVYYTPVVQPGGGYDPDLTWSETPPTQDTRSYGASLRAEWQGDVVTLKSISAYRDYYSFGIFDFDAREYDRLSSIRVAEYTTYSQELQATAKLGAIDVVAGLFFFDEEFAWLQTQHTFRDTGALPTGLDVRNHTRSYAAYGQLRYAITDRLTLTGGLRYSRESQTQDFVSKILDANDQFVSNAFVAIGEDHWGKLTPKVALDFQATPSVLLYASATQGFQIGGYTTRAATPALALVAARPATLWAFEGGVKADLFDRHARINISAFYNDQKDLIVFAFDPKTVGNTRVNADKAHAYGLEVEGSVLPLPNLTLSGFLTYLNASYDRFENPFGLGTSIADRELPYASKYTARAAVSQVVPLADGSRIRVGGNYQYQSSAFVDLLNTPQSKRPSQGLFNANLGFTSADRHWDVQLAVRNVADKRYDQISFYNSALNAWYRALNPPRTWTLSVQYSF